MPYADIEAFKELRRRAAEGRPLNPKRAKRKRFGTGAPGCSPSPCARVLEHSRRGVRL